MQLLHKEGDAKNFKNSKQKLSTNISHPIPLSKERFPFLVLPISKLYNVKSPPLPLTTFFSSSSTLSST